MYRQGDIVKCDIETCRSPGEVLSYKTCNTLSLRDELTGVELCNNTLQDLVHNGWKDSFVKIRPKRTVNLRQRLNIRPREDTTRYIDHLQVFGSRKGRNVSGLRTNIVDNWRLEPRDSQMSSFNRELLINDYRIEMARSKKIDIVPS